MGSRRAPAGEIGRLGSLLLLLATAGTAAASSNLGAIQGQVLGPEGHPLIQVLVRLEGNDLARAREQETDEQGRFFFGDLRPGTYGLRIDEPGFARFEDRQVSLPPGATIRIAVELWLDPFPDPDEPLSSAAERRALDWSAPSTGLVLTHADLDLLPLGRNPWSAAWLSTAAWPSENEILSVSPAFSAYRIAGVDVDRAMVPGPGASLPLAALEAVSVQLDRTDAADGYAPGALVELHPKWGGRKPWLDGEVFLWPGAMAKAPAHDRALGRLSLGSPLWGDKLQVIASLQVDMEHVGGTTQDNYFDLTAPEPLTRSDADYWGVDWLAGLRWQATAAHSLQVLTAGRLGRAAPLQADSYTAPEAQTAHHTLWNLASLQWRADWLPGLSQHTQLGLFHLREHLGPASGCTSLTDEACRSHTDQDTGLVTVNADRDQRSAWTRVQGQTRLTAKLDDLLGDHRLEAGLQFALAWRDVRDAIPGGASYTDRSGRPYRITILVPDQDGRLRADEQRARSDWVGLFLQESWSLTDHLIISPGLRFDWAQAEFDGRTMVPADWTFGPRLSVRADPGGDGKTRLLAGFHRSAQIRPLARGWGGSSPTHRSRRPTSSTRPPDGTTSSSGEPAGTRRSSSKTPSIRNAWTACSWPSAASSPPACPCKPIRPTGPSATSTRTTRPT